MSQLLNTFMGQAPEPFGAVRVELTFLVSVFAGRNGDRLLAPPCALVYPGPCG
jgi:hypothetical protein